MSNFGKPIELPKQLAYDNQVEGCTSITRISNVKRDGTLIEDCKAAE